MMKNVSLKKLKEYENNPRRNDHAVDKVAASIKEFGFKVPLVIDTENVIVCGHTRFKAAKQLGIKEVPCIVADDLSQDQIKAFRLVDNKTAELSNWDFGALNDEILNIDLDLRPFDLMTNTEGFNHIQDLLEFGLNKEEVNLEKNLFSVTFNFPIENKKVVLGYINEKGKSYFVDKIVKEAVENVG